MATIMNRDAFGNPVLRGVTLASGVSLISALQSDLTETLGSESHAGSLSDAIYSIFRNYGLSEDPYDEWTNDDDKDSSIIENDWMPGIRNEIKVLWNRYSKIAEAYETKLDWLAGIVNETTYDIHDSGETSEKGETSAKRSSSETGADSKEGKTTYDNVTDKSQSSSSGKTEYGNVTDKMTNDSLTDTTTGTDGQTTYALPNKSVSTPYGTPTSHVDNERSSTSVKTGGTTNVRSGSVSDSTEGGTTNVRSGGVSTSDSANRSSEASGEESGSLSKSGTSSNAKTGTTKTTGMTNPVAQRDLYARLLRDVWVEMARECSPWFCTMHL